MKFTDVCEATLRVLNHHIEIILNQENVNPLHLYYLFDLIWDVLMAC